MIGSIVELPVRARRPRGGRSRSSPTRAHADRLADGHRGRLQHRRRRPASSTPTTPAIRHDLDPARRRDGVRARHRGAARAAASAGIAPFTVMSCDNLPGNGRARAAGVHGLRPRSRDAGARRLDRASTSRSPTRWSTASRRSTTDEDRARAARALRHRGRLAGGVRAVHPVGARGRTSAPGGRRYEDGRRAGRRRRRAVRADEAAAAQRQPPGARATSATSPATGSSTRRRRTRCSRRSCSATWTTRRRRRCAPVPGRRPRRVQARR